MAPVRNIQFVKVADSPVSLYKNKGTTFHYFYMSKAAAAVHNRCLYAFCCVICMYIDRAWLCFGGCLVYVNATYKTTLERFPKF